MRTWRSFVYVLVGGFAFAILALAAFVLLMNPYGNLPQTVFSEHAITDTNQRFQYPALIRSKRYDSIVIGASDSRLMHPRALERVFGGRFANLALNAGRAYEQYRVAMLFIDEVQDRRTLVVGLAERGATKMRPKIARLPDFFRSGCTTAMSGTTSATC